MTQRTNAQVTADVLPTAQINGVVTTQVLIGNTVFAGGEFTAARPAGAAAGVNAVQRWNLMSYDIRTGVMTSFAPKLNGRVKALAKSADGATLYVGGQFTKVGTTTRNRFAAFTVSTGGLTSLAPSFNNTINALAVGKSIYAGGTFTAVGSTTRKSLAAFGTTGKLASWAPTADGTVQAMTATPDKTKVIVGGAFAHLNTTTVRGMGALDATTGVNKPWAINATVKDYGTDSAILSLTADATTVYGSGYAFGGGNFEGAFAAEPSTGKIKWLQDCHGDTYSVVPIGSTVYSVGHAHYCANIGGFPDTSPRTAWYRALAVNNAVAGTVATNGQLGPHYGNFAGQPAPSLVNWFPALEIGSYTGQNQAAWSITGNSSYLALGGEFPSVNGTAQQGLVRFAIKTIAPNKSGPVVRLSTSAPTLTSSADGHAVTVNWLANWDYDDRTLTYQVVRDGGALTTRSVTNQFWNRTTQSYVDASTQPGTKYRYVIVARDPDGNTYTSASIAITTAGQSGSSIEPPPGDGGE